MKKTWIITKRELASYFDSLIAYVIIVLFLVLTGYFTWIYPSNIFVAGQADLRVFFGWGYWTIFIFTPAITMRALSDENKSGTFELLATKPVSDMEIVMGKFLAAVLLMVSAIVCTLPYYFTIANLGDVDHGGIIGGYLGLVLVVMSYSSIGLFCSSLTNNQVVALLLSWILCFTFHFLLGLMTSTFSGFMADLLNFLSVQTHFNSLMRGVIDSRDILYFASLIITGLMMSRVILSKRNWTH
ncbi:MAG: ABC transporter permease [Cyclobacteriaceae bacterium]|nr:ABC transporter permease [Cyclobacteriaceae bacterium]